jgi:hypothetical protein
VVHFEVIRDTAGLSGSAVADCKQNNNPNIHAENQFIERGIAARYTSAKKVPQESSNHD